MKTKIIWLISVLQMIKKNTMLLQNMQFKQNTYFFGTFSESIRRLDTNFLDLNFLWRSTKCKKYENAYTYLREKFCHEVVRRAHSDRHLVCHIVIV